jgi:hypothetical protein
LTPFLTPLSARQAEMVGNSNQGNRPRQADSATYGNTWPQVSADCGSREGRGFDPHRSPSHLQLICEVRLVWPSLFDTTLTLRVPDSRAYISMQHPHMLWSLHLHEVPATTSKSTSGACGMQDPAYNFPRRGLLLGTWVNTGYYAARSLFDVMGSSGAAGSLGWNSATAASTVGTSW